MTDLEGAADVAVIRVKDLSAHMEKAGAALASLDERLEHVKEQVASDWTALEEKMRALLEVARAQAAAIAEDGQEARQGLADLDDALEKAAPEWDGALETGRSEIAALATHVSETEPVIAAAGDGAEAAARSLAQRAAAIEAQLQQAVADSRAFLENEVASGLTETREAIQQRASALQAALTDECQTVMEEAVTGWQQRLDQVEDLVDQEFASARKHAAAVVEFSLEECRRGHEEAWEGLSSLAADLDGLLQKLGEAVRVRTGELAERGSAAEETLAEATARVELMRMALKQEWELMAQYEFVRG